MRFKIRHLDIYIGFSPALHLQCRGPQSGPFFSLVPCPIISISYHPPPRPMHLQVIPTPVFHSLTDSPFPNSPEFGFQGKCAKRWTVCKGLTLVQEMGKGVEV